MTSYVIFLLLILVEFFVVCYCYYLIPDLFGEKIITVLISRSKIMHNSFCIKQNKQTKSYLQLVTENMSLFIFFISNRNGHLNVNLVQKILHTHFHQY